MSNYCTFEMRVLGNSRKSLLRLMDIMSLRDEEFGLPKIEEDPHLESLEETPDGKFVCEISGAVDNSCRTFIECEDRPDLKMVERFEKNEYGCFDINRPVYRSCHLTGLNHIKELLGIQKVEIWEWDHDDPHFQHIVCTENGDTYKVYREERDDENGLMEPDGFGEFSI